MDPLTESSSHPLARLLTGQGESAVARLLDSAAFSVAVFERGPRFAVAYLNRAAAAQASVAAEVAVGMPAAEVFHHLDLRMIERLFEEGGEDAQPTNLRGLLPGGGAWSIDAIRLGNDRVLVIAEELGDAVSSRQRLEALLSSADVIWRPLGLDSMAPLIVEQASRLLAGVDVGLWVQPAEQPGLLRLIATNSASMEIGREVPVDGSVAGEAAAAGTPFETSAAPEVGAAPNAAAVSTVRAVPLTAGERFPDGRTSIGALVFGKPDAAPYTDAERRLMDELGKLVGLAAHRSGLLLEARRSAGRFELALEVAMALSGSLTPRDIIDLLLRRTLETVGADRATLSRLEDGELVIEATHARSGELTWVGRRYSLGYLDRQPLVKQALESKMAVLGGRLNVAEAAPEFRDALQDTARTANLPLLLNGEAAGLLVVSRVEDRPFDLADLSTLQLMGNAAMLALRNAMLFEDLQLASTSKTEFLNLAAHELRTPVTVIRGYASILRSTIGEGDPADADRALAVIEQKTRELNKLVDSLLAAARVQTGTPTIERRALDAGGLVSEAAERAGPFARLAGGGIAVSLPSEPVQVAGSAEQVGRILDNLLNNAIAYTSGPPRIAVRVVGSPKDVEIYVEDHGLGIPESQHATVFDQFVRVEHPLAEPLPGAGLGLYIARGLAQSMGGDLTLARSAPGEGSVFVLRLPRPASPPERRDLI